MAKRVFITGGASGLGRALAERYAREGCSVCIGDLNDERGQETLKVLHAFGVKVHYLHCDVRSENDLQGARDWMKAQWGGVDVVVNNAGVAAVARIDELTAEDWSWITDTNLLGVVRGCRIFAPLFKEQGRGCFVNIASVAGFAPLLNGSPYNATKAAVLALSESLLCELSRFGIQVSVACPFFFRTNLTESLRCNNNPKREEAMKKAVDLSKINSSTIADRIYVKVERGDFLILPDWQGRWLYYLKRFLPLAVFIKLFLGIWIGRKRVASKG